MFRLYWRNKTGNKTFDLHALLETLPDLIGEYGSLHAVRVAAALNMKKFPERTKEEYVVIAVFPLPF